MRMDRLWTLATHGRCWTRASIRALAALACFGGTSLSSAAVATPFQQYEQSICGAGECVIGFDVPPIGKRLELYDVSCYLRMKGANEIRGMWLYLGAEDFLVALAPEATVGAGASEHTVYTANHSIFAYARAGVEFKALVQWTKGAIEQFACHISGNMVDAPG